MNSETIEIQERRGFDVKLIDGVLSGVSVLRSLGQNGNRSYSDRAMRDLIEAINNRTIPVYQDHEGKLVQGIRSVADIIGSLKNARINDGVVRADFSVLPRFRKTVEQLARDGVAGLSINATGLRTIESNGKQTVERLTNVRSVDLVAETGSTLNLMEQAPRFRPMEVFTKLRDGALTFEAAIKQLLADAWISEKNAEAFRAALVDVAQKEMSVTFKLPMTGPVGVVASLDPDRSGDPITESDAPTDAEFLRALKRDGIYTGETEPEPARPESAEDRELLDAIDADNRRLSIRR